MAVRQIKTGHFLPSLRGKGLDRIELYPAEQFDGREGLFRVRRKDTWLDGFKTLGEAALIAAGVLAEAAGLPEAEAPSWPELPSGTRVRVPSLRAKGFWEKTFTCSEPMQTKSGRFVVLVVGRREPVAVDELGPEVRQVGGDKK